MNRICRAEMVWGRAWQGLLFQCPPIQCQLFKNVLVMLLLASGMLVSGMVVAEDRAGEAVESSVAPVPSSRPPVSDKQARQELQQLMDKGLAMLAQELVDTGTFYPFAAVLGNDNEIRLVGVAASERGASPDAALAALVKKLKALAEERRVRAAAYFMDYVAQRADTGFSQPGIRVELNHRHPDALSVFVPYSVTSDRKLRLLTPQYRPGKNLTFDVK